MRQLTGHDTPAEHRQVKPACSDQLDYTIADVLMSLLHYRKPQVHDQSSVTRGTSVQSTIHLGFTILDCIAVIKLGRNATGNGSPGNIIIHSFQCVCTEFTAQVPWAKCCNKPMRTSEHINSLENTQCAVNNV